MTTLRKIAFSIAAISVIAAPVAASAASGAARATSAVSGENEFGGGSSWIIGLLGLIAGVTAAILIADDDDDAPVSP